MKLTHTPHRFYQFDNPKHAPFDIPATRWPTIVGKFFAPICQMKGVRAFGFLDHGDTDLELRLACRNYQVIEERMDDLGKNLGINRRPNTTTPRQTIGNGAFHGPDWIEDSRGKQWTRAQRRSELLFRYLHAGCALYLDTLVQDGAHFKTEEIKKLPLKNLFERCLHLVSNFSKAEFDVLVSLQNNPHTALTGGMGNAARTPKAAGAAQELYQLHL